MFETVSFYATKEMDPEEMVINLKESRPEVFEILAKSERRIEADERVRNFCKVFLALQGASLIPKSVKLETLKDCDFIDTILFYGEERYSEQGTTDMMFEHFPNMPVQPKELGLFINVIFELEGIKNPLRKRTIFTIDFFDFLKENLIKFSDISRLCNMTYSNFAYYKNGQRGINQNMIQKIEKEYGSHPDFFDFR